MRWACYFHDVATIQVKNLPDDLHAALRRRAELEGTTLSDLITRMLRRELSRPSMAEWLSNADLAPLDSDVDVAGALDEVRGEWPRARR